MATLLNTQGSTGGFIAPSSGYGPASGTTPQAKALNGPLGGMTGYAGLIGGSTAPQAPKSQPIASQVHTDAAGNSVKTTYVQPQTGPGSPGSGLNPNGTSTAIGAQPQTPAPQTAAPQTAPTPTNTTGGMLNQSTGSSPANPTSSVTYPGIIGSLVNTSQNGNPSAQAGVNGALGASQSTYGQGTGNTEQYSSEADTALKQLQNIQSGLATGIGDINQQAIPLEFQQGRAQALQNMYGGQEQALASEVQGLGSLYGTAAGQQSTGISGLLGGANAANTQQSNIQSGLTSAAGATAPSVGSYGQTQYSPLQAGQNSQGQVSPSDPFYPVMQSMAQLAASGQYNQIPSSITGNPVLLAQMNAMASSINPKYTPLTSSAIGAGTASGISALAGAQGIGAAAGQEAAAAAPGQAAAGNIQTAGTAATQAANTAYNNATQAVSKATGAYTAATGVASNLTSALSTWTQSGQLTNLNQAINTVAGLTSDPKYAQFNTAITNAQAAYTAAFQDAGITPTQSTLNALKELNPNSSATTIVASLNQLSSDLHAATIIPAYQQQQTYAQQLGITH